MGGLLELVGELSKRWVGVGGEEDRGKGLGLEGRGEEEGGRWVEEGGRMVGIWISRDVWFGLWVFGFTT